MKLREYLRDHPIVLILGMLASVAGIASFLLDLKARSDNKENEPEKHQLALSPIVPEKKDTALPNPEVKKDSPTVIKDPIVIELKKDEAITPVLDVWIEERSDTLKLKANETFSLPGGVRMSVLIYSGFSYVNVFFPGESGKNYKREELQMGEEKHFESPDSPYKFYITYLSFLNYETSSFIVKVWKKS